MKIIVIIKIVYGNGKTTFKGWLVLNFYQCGDQLFRHNLQLNWANIIYLFYLVKWIKFHFQLTKWMGKT